MDADELFAGPLTGRRIELTSSVQAAALKDGRLELTVTTRGLQLLVDVRHPDEGRWRSLIGADVRVRGVVVPANQAGDTPARIVVASPADVQPTGTLRTAPARPHQLLTSAAAIQALKRDDASAGHPVKLSARIMVNDTEWSVLFVHDGSSGIFVFTRSLDQPMPPCRPGDIVDIEGETGPANSRRLSPPTGSP